MDVKKYLLISIKAPHITGNPYKDTETHGWRAKALYFTYFDKSGIQLGRMRTIKLQRGQAITKELKNDIENDDVIKLSFAANTTRIYLSKLLDYPVHNYLNYSSWIDIQVLARLNGYKADTVTQLAKSIGIYSSNPFTVLVKCVKRLTDTGCPNLKQLAGYIVCQKINDQGVAIDTNILKTCLNLIDKYLEAIHLFENENKININKKKIKQYFTEKHDTSNTDDIYALLESPIKLSDFEIALIHILHFLNSSTVHLLRKVSNCICLDARIRGTIRYYQNYRTGFCGHANLFDRNHKHTTDLNYLIDKINCNKHLTIYQSAIIIYLLKALVPFLLNFNNPKIVVDINRTTEYAIAKITGCDWRIDAYKNGNLEAVLRKKWPSVSLPHVDVRKLDMQFALGNYHTQLDELQVNEWKECNKEIIITRGNLIHAAHSALTSNKQIWFQGIIFDQIDNNLLICLPTGRIIRIPVDYNKMEIKIIETGKRLTGSFLFGLICQCLQRDMLIHVVTDLSSQGYNIAYYTHDQIVIDDGKPLPPKILCSPYVTIK